MTDDRSHDEIVYDWLRRPAIELENALMALGGESPTDVYDEQGYQIWLRSVTAKIVYASPNMRLALDVIEAAKQIAWDNSPDWVPLQRALDAFEATP